MESSEILSPSDKNSTCMDKKFANSIFQVISFIIFGKFVLKTLGDFLFPLTWKATNTFLLLDYSGWCTLVEYTVIFPIKVLESKLGCRDYITIKEVINGQVRFIWPLCNWQGKLGKLQSFLNWSTWSTPFKARQRIHKIFTKFGIEFWLRHYMYLPIMEVLPTLTRNWTH